MLGFLNKRITVTFVNMSKEETLGVSKMIPDQLPDSFEMPTTLQFLDKEWRVVKADPVTKSEFSLTKKLTLYLAEVGFMNPKNFLFTVPTISNELPSIGNTKMFDDFTLDLHEDDWRQVEFLPIDILPAVQEEMATVEAILFPEGETGRPFGYDSIHVRSKIGGRHLKIPFADFCELVRVDGKGTIALAGHTGFVENGFALHSNNYTYYGTMEGNVIKELCLQRFESVDDEFATIVDRFKLLLVSWCRGEIVII